ncbi:amino acid adenylation domain-containing protein [Streptomyces sp. V4-01]|uniref:Amino acid adenylation domain-containing protein n=1 Tax=Actinacidiphila polyblastidii TaxID=3110430 RepID=A0ABU7PB31_9ACTN|nr:amino acid adenylation domain-containing protein [Streptomyces sp. V4-01]
MNATAREATAGDGHRTGESTGERPTALPRWTSAPRPGNAEQVVAIPHDILARLEQVADATGVTLDALMVSAHAKVLAVLTGEREVVTGYAAAAGDRPPPCRVTVAPGSWRALLQAAQQAVSRVLTSPRSPAERRSRGRDLPAPPPEAVFDPVGTSAPADESVLHVAVAGGGRRRLLRLRYRTDVLDAYCATRIARYHLTALTLIAADPDAGHDRQSLLSEGERLFQVEALAGPHRKLPDARFHELFEERVRAHPDRVAAIHGDQRSTYRELNVRANRLAHGLLAAGLRRQGVVAVAAERDLDWMAAVVAVWKAGGVYLPVEPHLPPDRVAAMLSRAGCDLVLAERGPGESAVAAVATRPGARVLFLDTAGEDQAEDDPGIAVGADDLAYIFFTSGSTGEPKGAMCEHAGMLNHLYAKIDDLRIREEHVVAQCAPQSFDISLWQLLAAPLAGGRTLLVEQAAILDVGRFLDTIAGGRAAVVQLVPSYLDVVLGQLERAPRRLPDLRCLSVTGEALKKELVRRWFAALPGVPLVNAYGLTETCDDTHHEVMDRVPDTADIPLGPPVANVHAYVVDDHLSPVPLGAPGEIVFSGICVGRGYVNDPERTRAAFTADPHHRGRRLYRTGDRGRWQPDGKLAFLGRGDAQVKLRGFRIEPGEIENALLTDPLVHDGAVVVSPSSGRDTLVAFYTGPRPLAPEALRDRLGRSLPAYMVPTAFQWLARLPLTGNGKVDRKALAARAADVDPEGSGESGWSGGIGDDRPAAPRTPTEQRLAAAWAATLEIAPDRIGRHDRFPDLGGTSLSAVRVAIRLDRAVSPKDMADHPVLADLADLVDARAAGERPHTHPPGRGPDAAEGPPVRTDA